MGIYRYWISSVSKKFNRNRKLHTFLNIITRFLHLRTFLFFHWNQAWNISPTVHVKTMFRISQFKAVFGLSYAKLCYKSSWLCINLPQIYPLTFLPMKSGLECLSNVIWYDYVVDKSKFLANFGLNHALIMRQLSDYAWTEDQNASIAKHCHSRIAKLHSKYQLNPISTSLEK